MTAEFRFNPKRGEIYVVEFDPAVGAEIKKTRPGLVLQNDITNQYGSLTIVAPLTSVVEGKIYPTEILIPKGEGGLHSDSIVLLGQIRTVDKVRLKKYIGVTTADTMLKAERAILVSLGIEINPWH